MDHRVVSLASSIIDHGSDVDDSELGDSQPPQPTQAPAAAQASPTQSSVPAKRMTKEEWLRMGGFEVSPPASPSKTAALTNMLPVTQHPSIDVISIPSLPSTSSASRTSSICSQYAIKKESRKRARINRASPYPSPTLVVDFEQEDVFSPLASASTDSSYKESSGYSTPSSSPVTTSNSKNAFPAGGDRIFNIHTFPKNKFITPSETQYSIEMAPQQGFNEPSKPYFSGANGARFPTQFNLVPNPASPAQVKGTPRKTHNRKKSAGHIPRPRNAFILFRSYMVSSASQASSGTGVPAAVSAGLPISPSAVHVLPSVISLPKDVKNVSKVVAEVWKSLSPESRRIWDDMAEEEKRQHKIRWPDYKYRPKGRGSKKTVAKDEDDIEEDDIRVAAPASQYESYSAIGNPPMHQQTCDYEIPSFQNPPLTPGFTQQQTQFVLPDVVENPAGEGFEYSDYVHGYDETFMRTPAPTVDEFGRPLMEDVHMDYTAKTSGNYRDISMGTMSKPNAFAFHTRNNHSTRPSLDVDFSQYVKEDPNLVEITTEVVVENTTFKPKISIPTSATPVRRARQMTTGGSLSQTIRPSQGDLQRPTPVSTPSMMNSASTPATPAPVKTDGSLGSNTSSFRHSRLARSFGSRKSSGMSVCQTLLEPQSRISSQNSQSSYPEGRINSWQSRVADQSPIMPVFTSDTRRQFSLGRWEIQKPIKNPTNGESLPLTAEDDDSQAWDTEFGAFSKTQWEGFETQLEFGINSSGAGAVDEFGMDGVEDRKVANRALEDSHPGLFGKSSTSSVPSQDYVTGKPLLTGIGLGRPVQVKRRGIDDELRSSVSSVDSCISEAEDKRMVSLSPFDVLNGVDLRTPHEQLEQGPWRPGMSVK